MARSSASEMAHTSRNMVSSVKLRVMFAMLYSWYLTGMSSANMFSCGMPAPWPSTFATNAPLPNGSGNG